MDTSKNYYPFWKIEHQRSELLRSREIIDFVDYGAKAEGKSITDQRKVSEIASSSLSGKWQCRTMFNLVNHYKPRNILELGTSFGISTAYLASTNSKVEVLSLEGNPTSATIASKVFSNLSLKNVNVRVGEFSKTLPEAVEDLKTIDLAFIDGNHRKIATLKYFEFLKKYSNTSSIFIFDDIYWSDEMNDAWEEIKNDSDVAFTIDLYRMGLVFFDKTIMKKQHFTLINYRWKPWKIGLFG